MNDVRSDKPHGAGISRFEPIEAKKLFQVLALEPWFTVLDMGCGLGMYSIVLAKIIGNGGLVYAVDLWAEGMERLRERIECSG